VITQVTVERLYNLGNYENIRLAATATVEEGKVKEAFAEAGAAVEAHYTAFIDERAEAARKAQEEYEERRRQQRAEMEARRQRPVEDGDPIF
jgi:hypothetical protein